MLDFNNIFRSIPRNPRQMLSFLHYTTKWVGKLTDSEDGDHAQWLRTEDIWYQVLISTSRVCELCPHTHYEYVSNFTSYSNALYYIIAISMKLHWSWQPCSGWPLDLHGWGWGVADTVVCMSLSSATCFSFSSLFYFTIWLTIKGKKSQMVK